MMAIRFAAFTLAATCLIALAKHTQQPRNDLVDGVLLHLLCRSRIYLPRNQHKETAMSEIAELRDLQREYIEKRNHCHVLIRNQQDNLSNCSPGPSTIQACRKQADGWRADANDWQKRIDAIQKKLDEAIGF